MSIASNLQALGDSLNDKLKQINTKLIKKGSTAASTLSDVPAKIQAIPQQGTGDTSDATATAADIKAGTSAYIADGYVDGEMEEIESLNSNLSISGSTLNISVESDEEGYIPAETSIDVGSYNIQSLDSNLVSSKIKAGETIFGVTGNYPSQTGRTITTNGNYNVADDRTVNIQVPTGGSSLPATTETANGDILLGKTAYKVDSNGDATLLTGAISSQSAQTITPTTTDQTIQSGVYLAGNQTIKGDANLVPQKIKHGETIFGISGSYPSATHPNITENNTYDVRDYASVTVNVPTGGASLDEITANDITLSTPTGGGSIIVANTASADKQFSANTTQSKTVSNLTASNIKSGTNILGITGTYTDVATASVPSASEIAKNKIAYANGNQITGTAQTKSSSDLTVSGNTVTVPAGFYTSNASKSVSTVTQATPTISVNSSTGVITASSSQSAGYVSSGTKTATYNLTTQGAQTITPSTSNKTIQSGRFLTGTQTILGDSNLVASNIKNGVDIFGVTGTYTGSSGGNIRFNYQSGTVYRYATNELAFNNLTIPSGSTLVGVYISNDIAAQDTSSIIRLLVAIKTGNITSSLVLLGGGSNNAFMSSNNNTACNFLPNGNDGGQLFIDPALWSNATFGVTSYTVCPIYTT